MSASRIDQLVPRLSTRVGVIKESQSALAAELNRKSGTLQQIIERGHHPGTDAGDYKDYEDTGKSK